MQCYVYTSKTNLEQIIPIKNHEYVFDYFTFKVLLTLFEASISTKANLNLPLVLYRYRLNFPYTYSDSLDPLTRLNQNLYFA